MKSLKDYARDNSKFVKIRDGESLDLIYQGYSYTKSEDDPDKENVLYEVNYLDQPGKKFYWKTSSVFVAASLSEFQPGQIFKVSRTGDGKNTRYKITTP